MDFLSASASAEDTNERLKLLYSSVKRALRSHGVERPDREARLLMGHVFGLSDSDIILLSSSEDPGFRRDNDLRASEGEESLLAALLHRRLSGEPLSRIFGTREFWGLPFELSLDTLDPRPDTETLIEAVLERFKEDPPKRILDIGTGSGCILIALLHEFPQAHGVGTDLSAGAVAVAERNATVNGVMERAAFIQTCWAEGIEGDFDLIVSNPPYIPTHVIPNLSPEVRNHDPILALDGGEDGMAAYKILISEIKKRLASEGRVFFETGYDQAEQVARLVAEYGATPVRIIPDMGGNQRVVEWHWG